MVVVVVAVVVPQLLLLVHTGDSISRTVSFVSLLVLLEANICKSYTIMMNWRTAI